MAHRLHGGRRDLTKHRDAPRSLSLTLTGEILMNVQEIMTTPARCCTDKATLTVPAQLMWDHDCGMVPVIDAEGALVGVITDRDICMAAYTRGQALAAISVSEVMSRGVHTIHAEESLDATERAMSAFGVRRLPVVDSDDRPLGVVSMNDLARAIATRRRDGQAHELVETLAAIGKHREGPVESHFAL